jgi:hypothetical protein
MVTLQIRVLGHDFTEMVNVDIFQVPVLKKSSLTSGVFILTVLARPARGEHKTQLPGWLELANDAFYLIGSAVFQCIEYH